MADDPTEDDDLLAGVRSGRRSALQQLLERHRPTFERNAQALVGAQLKARVRLSDLLQSTFLAVVASSPDFQGEDETAFVRWVTRILENNVRDAARYHQAARRDRRRETSDQELALLGLRSRGAGPETQAILSEELLQVSRALQRLPDDYRKIILFRLTRGGTHEDAARAMGRSNGATRVLLARARAALLVELERERGDAGDG